MDVDIAETTEVSTHSRSKAAASSAGWTARRQRFQLTAARRRLLVLRGRRHGYSFVSTHSRSKAAAKSILPQCLFFKFQLTAARRRLHICDIITTAHDLFQLTAARRRLRINGEIRQRCNHVSTHSRSKAAAGWVSHQRRAWHCFNSQPLEGGCDFRQPFGNADGGFQLTAARRRLLGFNKDTEADLLVSTHSRSKAAARIRDTSRTILLFQLTAARRRLQMEPRGEFVIWRFQLTAARRRLQPQSQTAMKDLSFQLTAARRRLPGMRRFLVCVEAVSTHSRSKAAAYAVRHQRRR